MYSCTRNKKKKTLCCTYYVYEVQRNDKCLKLALLFIYFQIFKKSMTGDSSVLPVYLTVQQIIATSFSIGKKTRRRDFARFYNCYICLVCTRVRKKNIIHFVTYLWLTQKRHLIPEEKRLGGVTLPVSTSVIYIWLILE